MSTLNSVQLSISILILLILILLVYLVVVKGKEGRTPIGPSGYLKRQHTGLEQP